MCQYVWSIRCCWVLKYSISTPSVVSMQPQLSVFTCVPLRVPLAETLCAAGQRPCWPAMKVRLMRRAQLLPPEGHVYSLTVAAVVTLPSRKTGRKYSLRWRSPRGACLNLPPPSPPLPPPSERSGAVSGAPSAILIKGCDVGRQLSLLEPIPEIRHRLPRAICLAASVWRHCLKIPLG